MGTLHVAVAMEKMALEGEYQRPLPQMHDISSKIPALSEPLGHPFCQRNFLLFYFSNDSLGGILGRQLLSHVPDLVPPSQKSHALKRRGDSGYNPSRVPIPALLDFRAHLAIRI